MQEKTTFYFTFGSDKNMPFQGGWVEIEAVNEKQAIDLFKARYGERAISKNGLINCADWYSEKSFKKTSMYSDNENRGAGCHERISLMVISLCPVERS